jgi:trehalose/maltose hydrolase-like predicted phosphorylase
MLPGVMLLFPELVRQSILYRIAMLPGARKKAKKHGFKGAMYPWESGRTGIDVCPGSIYADYQLHITACVVYAIRQYIYVTGSWDILTEDGAWDIVKETADYWVSRVKWDGDYFVIDHVMDPDEYHYNVDNSCFTNAAARLNLLFAIEAAGRLGKATSPGWKIVSVGIKIPFDEKLRYHPEYDGYTQGTLIKQASVVLLGYPLGVPMDADVRKNDIVEYERCTDKGPGMTYSMYSIGMLELGQLETAEQLFKVQFKNLRQPFRIWNEYPYARGCANFLTAVGGFLQSLLYGYLGARVKEQFLQVNPHVLPDCSKVTYTGVSYNGERFNFTISKEGFQVCRTTGNAFELWYIIDEDGKKWPLVSNEIVSLALGLYKICFSDEYDIV